MNIDTSEDSHCVDDNVINEDFNVAETENCIVDNNIISVNDNLNESSEKEKVTVSYGSKSQAGSHVLSSLKMVPSVLF